MLILYIRCYLTKTSAIRMETCPSPSGSLDPGAPCEFCNLLLSQMRALSSEMECQLPKDTLLGVSSLKRHHLEVDVLVGGQGKGAVKWKIASWE